MTIVLIILILTLLNFLAWFGREWQYRQSVKALEMDLSHHRATIINQHCRIDELEQRCRRLRADGVVIKIIPLADRRPMWSEYKN